MLIKIGSMALRVCVLIELILGILLWASLIPNSLIPVHMLIGLLAMISLWLLGIGTITAPKGGNLGLGIAAIIVGLLLPIVGLGQLSFLSLTVSTHWIIQVIHLLIGLSAIGLGEVIAGRYRRANKVAA